MALLVLIPLAPAVIGLVGVYDLYRQTVEQIFTHPNTLSLNQQDASENNRDRPYDNRQAKNFKLSVKNIRKN